MVDLVHLRAEAYTADSRIPETTFAKPIEDASRRDITINALFYNLHTQQVEDFTGQGLADLAAGVIRTPLEPVQTFLDDPLRVLRAIRFACAFGYRLDDKLTEVRVRCRTRSTAHLTWFGRSVAQTESTKAHVLLSLCVASWSRR